MREAQKAQSPVAAGQGAETKTDTGIVAPLEESGNVGKSETTLLAQFSIAGHAVHRLAEGGYLVCKHGQARHCPDLNALAGFARQTGVRQ